MNIPFLNNAFQNKTMSFLPTDNKSLSVVRWTLYIGAFLIPLAFAPWTSSFLDINKQLLIVLMAVISLVGYLLNVVITGRVRIRHTLIDWGVATLALGAVITSLAGLSFDRSVFGSAVSNGASMLTVLSLAIIYFASVQVFEDRGKRLGNIIMSSLLVAVLFGLFQMLTVYIFSFGFMHSRVFNTVGSVNALGMLAAIALPLFTQIRLAPQRMPKLNVSYLGLAASLAVLVILNWWPLWAVAFVGMLALIAAQSAGSNSNLGYINLQKLMVPMLVTVLGAVMIVTGFSVSAVKKQLPLEIVPDYGLSLSIAGNALGERSLVGYGPEQFSLAFDRYGASKIADSTISNATFFESVSEAVTAVTEGGVLGMIALLTLLVVGVISAAKLLWNRDVNNESRAIGAALIAGFTAIFLYPFTVAMSFVLFILLALAGLEIAGESEKTFSVEQKPALSMISSLSFVVGLVIAIVGAYAVGTHYAGEVAYAQGLKSKSPREAVERLTVAVSRNPDNDRMYIALSQAIVSFISQDISTKADPADVDRSKRIQNNITNAISIAQRATEIGPRDATNWLNLATVYQSLVGLVDGSDQAAENAFMKAAEFRPGDPGIPNRIGLMYINKSDLARQFMRSAGANTARFQAESDAALVKAEEAFKTAVALAPNFGQAIYNLGSVYERQGKLTESIRQIERIIPANSGNSNLIFELGLLYYRVGRKTEALAALERVVALEPQYANARWYLALLYEEKRDILNAIAQIEKILETNKDNQVVIDKLTALKAGRIEFPPGKVIDKKPL